MKEIINQWLESQPKQVLVSLSVLICLVIGLIDYVVKIDLSFSIFYWVPIGVAAWYVNKNAGLSLAVLCSLAWIFAETAAREYSSPLLPAWNFTIRLFSFLLVGYLIALQRQAYQKEAQLARTDDLTGLYNRRFFVEVLRLEMERSRRYHTHFTLAYLDLDNFKAVNDLHGHKEGDRLLKAMSQQLVSTLRESDIIGRLGGDEFVILMPQTNPDQAHCSLGRVHTQLKSSIGNTWPVGFSIGAVSFVDSSDSVDQAIAQADQIMYDIKRSGKNRLELRVARPDPSIVQEGISR